MPAGEQRRSSLFRRMMVGFAATTAAIWLLIAGFTIHYSLRLGDEQVLKGLSTYSRQIMAAAVAFADEPDRLARALADVQAIEGESAEPEGSTLIQVWKAGEHLGPTTSLPPTVPAPEPGVQYFEHEGRAFVSQVRFDAGTAVTVRTSVQKRSAVNLMWPSAGFLFVPLLPSLPLLLIPAWLTIRRGLSPLRALVAAIEARVRSLSLEPVGLSAYRELAPLVAAVNELMARLRGQLDRERAFVAEVAHEIKTPLAIVRANLDAVRAPVSAARREAALDDLGAGVDRADHLIRQLLQLARMEHDARDHAWRRFDLSEFIRQRVAALVPVADRQRVTIAMQADDGLACTSDPDAVGAIIDNLLDNAIKFSPAGGTVRIGLASIDADARLSVSDEGPGIAPHLREAAFERFSRLGAGDRPGVGLGLAIVARAVRRIGGTMTIDETPPVDRTPGVDTAADCGEGLRVLVRMPLEAPQRTSPSV